MRRDSLSATHTRREGLKGSYRAFVINIFPINKNLFAD